MKASLTKLQTVSITSADSLSAFCRFAGFVEVKRVLRQLHCDKHKADPFSLDTLHLHHFSIMFRSFSAREHNRSCRFPKSVKSERVCSTVGKMCASKHRIEASKHLSISHASSCGWLHQTCVPTSEVQQIQHSNTTRLKYKRFCCF